jgi:hypothetical protein
MGNDGTQRPTLTAVESSARVGDGCIGYHG